MKKMGEVQRELEERQHLAQKMPAGIEPAVTFGPERLDKNPLDKIDNDILFSDIESKTALIKGRLQDRQEDLKDL